MSQLINVILLQAQIHLLGNPVTWYSATLSVLAYMALLAFYVIRRHRHCYDISEGMCDIH